MKEGQRYMNIATREYFTLEKRPMKWRTKEYEYRLVNDNKSTIGFWLQYYPMVKNIYDGFRKVES